MANLETSDSAKLAVDVTQDVADNFTSENTDRAMEEVDAQNDLNIPSTPEEALKFINLKMDNGIEAIFKLKDMIKEWLNSEKSMKECFLNMSGGVWSEFFENANFSQLFKNFDDIVKDLKEEHKDPSETQIKGIYKMAICAYSMFKLFGEKSSNAITEDDMNKGLTSFYDASVSIANNAFGKNYNYITKAPETAGDEWEIPVLKKLSKEEVDANYKWMTWDETDAWLVKDFLKDPTGENQEAIKQMEWSKLAKLVNLYKSLSEKANKFEYNMLDEDVKLNIYKLESLFGWLIDYFDYAGSLEKNSKTLTKNERLERAEVVVDNIQVAWEKYLEIAKKLDEELWGQSLFTPVDLEFKDAMNDARSRSNFGLKASERKDD